jgi:hypothetical protein
MQSDNLISYEEEGTAVARTPTYKKREELSSLLTHKGRQ